MEKQIVKWVKDYAKKNKINALVIGVSGGIDSAVVSTLCAKTKLPTFVLSMPIKQNKKLHNLSLQHCKWLADSFDNVTHLNIDLTCAFKAFEKKLSETNSTSLLGFANSRSRLRMMTLYQVAQSNNGIVVGTGNKVEDFGVGFFTKYGDGGVDISPIGDLMKSEVWDLGRQLGVSEDIVNAPPTDGLWDDGRNDEDQLGMSYGALEVAMVQDELGYPVSNPQDVKNLKKYRKIRARNLHKMLPIPVFKKPESNQ